MTATAELKAATLEIVQVVRVLDGFNRIRFANDPEQLAAWESATSLAEASRPVLEDKEPPASGGAEEPAA